MKAGWRIASLVMVSSLLLWPVVTKAQTLGSGAIAGVVRDTTGAVLPGVTVEAASPALIEKVRTVVTDSQGLYRIIDLRPGVYTVTFTLPGFNTVKREGLELPASFTATVNGDLQVGSVAESITVSAESPVVDIQNVVQQKTFSREVLDKLPFGKSASSYASLIPGANLTNDRQDVGGINQGSRGFTIHGGTADTRNMMAGISFDSPQEVGANVAFTTNRASVQEVSVEVGGMGAEAETGGVQLNFVPKDGGNTFAVYSSAEYGNGNMQNSNMTDTLRARGLPVPNKLKEAYDYSFGVGGPIKRDKVWFYTAHRWVGSSFWAPTYWNALPKTSWYYQPDLSHQAFSSRPYQNSNVRMTWQATQKQKVAVSFENQHANCDCLRAAATNRAPEATGDHWWDPNRLTIVNWTYPSTNRMLFEATAGIYSLTQHTDPVEGVTSDIIAVEDLTNGFFYRARGPGLSEGNGYNLKKHTNYTQRVSMSYVTGSHAFKTGVVVQENFSDHFHTQNGDATYRIRNGVPSEIALWATPWNHKEKLLPVLGVFAQDQWTLSKLTLNLGLRFDSLKGSIPAQDIPAGTYVPARHFDGIGHSVPDWKDLNPRLGAAYDLFGNGKTALKVSLGRYVFGEGTSTTVASNNPANQMVGGATRSWNDANTNWVPDCSLLNPVANGECGPLSDLNFGKVVSNTTFANDLVTGYAAREYTWQGSASIQHELRPGFAVNVGYFRTSYGNPVAAENTLVTTADYDPYCLTAPVDARLPGGGGNQICGLYDINPAKFGLVNNLVTAAEHYGKVKQVFNGIDMTINTRFGRGAVLAGGVSMGSKTTDTCDLSSEFVALSRGNTTIANSPNKRFCRVSPSWSSGTQTKLFGAYPLPWDLQASATYQNMPGVPITASYVAASTEVRSSLGRNLSSGRATIELIEPGTQFEDRLNQLDLSFSKAIRMGRTRLQGIVNVYNVLNASSILGINARYGPSWLNVTQIMDGRFLKFGAQLEF